MKGFDAKFMDELKSKNDLVDVVSQYVKLEQRGSNFWGRCPFHHEKTASFCVNSIDQFYYCFGCHTSGDVVTFIMHVESLDFLDAVKFLAERAKMQLPQVNYDDEKVKEQKKLKQRLLDLLRETALFYVGNLRSAKGENHYAYIRKRGFTEQTVLAFGMGASFNYNDLPNHLRSKGYTRQEMLLAGVVGGDENRCYDPLAGRLIIPMIDQFNNVVAFDGRRIDNIKEQKYINTKETQIFIKGKTLFNINNLKKVKNEQGIDSVIIVEGHLDVVSLYQAGFRNVVASMGTALTKDQARILKRYSEKIIISYDGDSAGQKAIMRGLDILSEEGLDVKVAVMPEGKDPDDVIRERGAEVYREILLNAKPLVDFKIDVLKKTYDIKTVDGKRKFIVSAVNVIRESTSPAEQEDLLKIVRDATGTTLEALKRELYKEPEKNQNTQPQVTTEVGDTTGGKNVLAARFILYSYLFNKPYAWEYDVNKLNLQLAEHKYIQKYLASKQEKGERAKFNELYEEQFDGGEQELSRIAGLETNEKKFDQATYFYDCLRTLKNAYLSTEIESLNKMFASETDTEKRKEIAKRLAELLAEKNKRI